VEPSGIVAAFEVAFDQALLHHGFADHMRDYDLFLYVTADPRTGIRPEHLRYRFTHCVRATATTALSPQIWKTSLDERLLDHAQAEADGVDGYVWGDRWQLLYPGPTLMRHSAEAQRWSGALGIPFHEATIETNCHNLTLVFSDLIVEPVPPGHIPFAVPDGGPEFKIYLQQPTRT
jgi:hypothetical protein